MSIIVTDRRAGSDERKTWYFTFGIGDAEHAGHFVVVNDATFDEARAKMFAAFDRKWAFQYDESQWFRDGSSQATDWRLTEIEIP